MHFFSRPTAAGTKTFCYNTIPKRKESLVLGPDDSLRAGWALVFVDRISWFKIAIIESVFLFTSFIFAGVWSETHERNISDAFAPSACILAAGNIVMTLLYHYE